MSTPKARRADRRYRCARCGFVGEYRNATAKEGRNYFQRHSCQKVEHARARAAMREAREVLIDRTPKPCLHKYADHQHGTRACYVLDICRCRPCADASAAAENERTRLKAYGRYHKYVDAEPVRAHIRNLMAFGIGLKQITRLTKEATGTSVSGGTLHKLMYGSNSRLDGKPSRRVLRATAEKIYAIEPIRANLAGGALDLEGTDQARLRLRALVRLGWSQSCLGRRLGIHPTNFSPAIQGSRTLTRGTVDAIDALYAELSMSLPPETNPHERISAARARNRAIAAGWLAPLDLEDVTGADVDDRSADVDEVAIERRLSGDATVRLNQAEKRQAYRTGIRRGLTKTQLERLLGINSARLDQEALPDGCQSWRTAARPRAARQVVGVVAGRRLPGRARRHSAR